jgi:hypothetical protein
MIDTEKSLSRLQIDVLHELYKFVQESDSQAKLSNSRDSKQIEKLLEDFGEAFPFLRPWNQYRVSVTRKYVIGAQSREHCAELMSEIRKLESLDDNLVDSEMKIDTIVYGEQQK